MLEEWIEILPIFIICTYISFFRIGLGPIPWFMTSELLGTDHENRAQSYIASYSWLLSFVVMKSFIPLINDWPVALWLGYSVLSVLGFLFILFFVPETNNKSVEEIRLSLMKMYQLKSKWVDHYVTYRNLCCILQSYCCVWSSRKSSNTKRCLRSI